MRMTSCAPRAPGIALSEERQLNGCAFYGAFMEPSGRNQWQPVANAPASQAAKTSQTRWPRLPPVACELHGKEGVDGSSPSEGSLHKMPANRHFWSSA